MFLLGDDDEESGNLLDDINAEGDDHSFLS